jgi:integrase/recombinase XerD
MGYKGQKFKTMKRQGAKPKAPVRQVDPLAKQLLIPYMEAHFEWMLVTGYTPYSVKGRRIAIRRFIAWCDERGIEKPTDISKAILERYQRYLYYYRKTNGEPLSIGTQAGHLAPLKTWFKWLCRQNHILFNPASELEIPPLPRRLPRYILSIQEVEAILNEAEPTNAYGLRDRALLEFLYSTGLRRMEATNVSRFDVDVHRRVVFVREGKGRKDRVVPIGERALAWLDRYILEARPQLLTAEHDILFVTDYGEPANPAFIAKRVKVYMEFAKVHKPGATHLFRHAMATHMLEAGADVRILQALLGHSNLNTTEIYTHVSIDHLRAIHDATHPAKLKREEKPDTEAIVSLLAALEKEEE